MRDYRNASEEDRRWMRRDDARTLANAEEIKADKERYKQAKIGAREILDEENRRLDGMAKVAGQKVHYVQPDLRREQGDARRDVPSFGGNALWKGRKRVI